MPYTRSLAADAWHVPTDIPEAVAKSARILCRRHVQTLIGETWEVKEGSR